MSQQPSPLYQKYIKRLLDILLSFIALIILSPLFILVWIGLSISNKGAGAFFTQKRPGKDEKIFKLYKFKSMTDEKDTNGDLLPDSERLTKVGKFIRKVSLDELPQLWNILKGDMSFIGPRPLLVKYLPIYASEERRRHNVRPGIVGLAGVRGRNNNTWKKKFEYDIYYVDHLSFVLDLKIFFQAIAVVLSRKGVTLEGEATTESYNGHN
nr:sugar transferase [uncultured Porphyromonas sp.]